MSDLPEKQIKRLKSLIQEAETNLAAAKELLISIVGDDGSVNFTFVTSVPRPGYVYQEVAEEPSA